MSSTYSNYVKIIGCVESTDMLVSKQFDPEQWIPAPSGMISTDLEQWKLSNWGCTRVYISDSGTNVLTFNEENNSMELRFLSSGGAPVAFYNRLAGMFRDCLIEYEYFEVSGSCAGYGMGIVNGEPSHFVITDSASLLEAKNAKVWTLSTYFI